VQNNLFDILTAGISLINFCLLYILSMSDRVRLCQVRTDVNTLVCRWPNTAVFSSSPFLTLQVSIQCISTV